jgi:hypothetical protein
MHFNQTHSFCIPFLDESPKTRLESIVQIANTLVLQFRQAYQITLLTSIGGLSARELDQTLYTVALTVSTLSTSASKNEMLELFHHDKFVPTSVPAGLENLLANYLITGCDVAELTQLLSESLRLSATENEAELLSIILFCIQSSSWFNARRIHRSMVASSLRQYSRGMAKAVTFGLAYGTSASRLKIAV